MPLTMSRLDEGYPSAAPIGVPPPGGKTVLARAHPDAVQLDSRALRDNWASMRLSELASARGIGRALVAMELARAETAGHLPPAVPEGATLLPPLREGFAAAWLALPLTRRLRILARTLARRTAPPAEGPAPAFSYRLAAMAFGGEPRAMEAFRAWEEGALREAVSALGEAGVFLCEDPADAERVIGRDRAAVSPRGNRLSSIVTTAVGIVLSIGLGILVTLKAVLPDEPLRFALWALATALPVFPLCVLSGGHPLAALGAFLSAPAMAILPFLGTGMVAGFLQLKLDPPRLSDAMGLKDAVKSFEAARRNRLLRVVLAWSSASLAGSLGIALGGILLTLF